MYQMYQFPFLHPYCMKDIVYFSMSCGAQVGYQAYQNQHHPVILQEGLFQELQPHRNHHSE